MYLLFPNTLQHTGRLSLLVVPLLGVGLKGAAVLDYQERLILV
jgi:hypothetical protein